MIKSQAGNKRPVMPSQKKLAAKLIAMANKDQKMRRQHDKTGEWQPGIDNRNTKNMKQIVSRYGWPTVSLVGKKANFSAWLLVQHADFDPHFQAYCLDLMKRAAQKNPKDMSKRNIAYLIDRVRVNRGAKQLLGTQFYIKGGEIIPRPIWNLKNLEKRRMHFDLEPFEKYKQRMKNSYKQYQKNMERISSEQTKKGA